MWITLERKSQIEKLLVILRWRFIGDFILHMLNLIVPGRENVKFLCILQWPAVPWLHVDNGGRNEKLEQTYDWTSSSLPPLICTNNTFPPGSPPVNLQRHSPFSQGKCRNLWDLIEIKFYQTIKQDENMKASHSIGPLVRKTDRLQS